MNHKQLSTLILSLLIFTTANLTSTVFSTTNTIISTTPKYAYSFVYQSFTVNITILNVTNLVTCQVKLSFNPRIINCTNVFVPEDNIFYGHATTFGFEIDNEKGSFKAFSGIWETTGVNGSGKIFSVTFQALSMGISALSFTDLGYFNGTYLQDPQNKLIPFEPNDGIIQVNAEGFNLYVFNVIRNGIPYNITIFSNSSITNFNFNATIQKIDFYASNPQNTLGYCSVSIPKPLLNGTFAILVNNRSVAYTMSVDASNQYLCFDYPHTTTEPVHIQIITTVFGDINGDRKVDMRDVAIVARAFGTSPGNARWDPRADISNDLKVDMKDIAVIAKNFGNYWRI